MFLDAHAPDQPNYSRSEVKRIIRDAKTPEDFDRLADYFDGRAMQFEQKSQDEMKELQRLLALPYHARSYFVQTTCKNPVVDSCEFTSLFPGQQSFSEQWMQWNRLL